MKTSHWLILAGVVGLLYFKAQKSSTSTGQGGEGGAPAWSKTSGPMGPSYNPLTGTMEMAPLLVNY